MDPLRLPLRRFCNLGYYRLIDGADKEHRKKIDGLLSAPPPREQDRLRRLLAAPQPEVKTAPSWYAAGADRNAADWSRIASGDPDVPR